MVQGISLTVDQYNTLLAAAPLLESLLAQKDVDVVRPVYDADTSAKEEGKDEEEAGEEDEEVVTKVDDDEEEE